MTPPVVHRHQIRIYYQDTDAGGIVYHARYLDFAERARTEMLREFGLEPAKMRRDHGVIFAIRRCSLRFDAPAKLDDLLAVATRVVKLGGARLSLRQDIERGDSLLASIDIELAMLTEALRPTRLPQVFRQKVENIEARA